MLQLRDYQLERLQYHLKNDRSLELLPMGRGKTPIACVYARIQWDLFKEKSVWVMPVALLSKNKDEIMKWCEFSDEEVALLNVPKNKRMKIYADQNVKAFMMSGDTYAREWRELPSDVNVVIIDEFHQNFGSHTSMRTQQFYVSSRRFKKIKIMTGTLIAGKYSSAYPAIAVIEPRYYLNYNNFLAYHGVFNNFNQIVAWRNPDKLREILSRHSSGLNDPFAGRKNWTEIIFEKCNFDEKQKMAYKEMEEEALLELEDKFIDARDSGGVKQIRCRQILSCPESIELKVGFIGKDDMLKVHLLNAKEENERLVIFSVFNAEQNRIKRLCLDIGVRAEIMNGDVPSSKRAEIDRKFQNKEIDVIIGSPKIASIGFNWEFIKEIIFTSMSYDNSEFSQAMGRGDRGSRTRPLLVYILTYDTKVEKRIMTILYRKSDELKKIFSKSS